MVDTLDRSRSIDANELGNALRQFGYTLSPQFINLVVFKYDRSGTARPRRASVVPALARVAETVCVHPAHGRAAGARTLSFDDFIQVCILLTNLTNSFKRYDTQRVRLCQHANAQSGRLPTLAADLVLACTCPPSPQNGWANMQYEQFLTESFRNLPT